MINRFIDLFENHQIHSSIETVRELIESIEVNENYTTELIVEISRFRKALEFIKNCISSIDPEILPVNQTTQTLNSMVQQFTNIINYLNQFISNRDVGEIKNANAHIDTILQQSTSLNYIKTKSTARAIANATRDYDKTIEKYLTKLEEKNISVNNYLDTIKNDTEKLSEMIDIKTSEFQEIVTDIYTKIENSTSELIDKQETIIRELNTTIKNKFNEIDEDFGKLNTDLEARYEEKVSKIYGSAEDIINILNEKRDKASTLLQIIGNIGVTGDFKNNAEVERKNANAFRIIALIFMGLTVIGAIYIVFMANKNSFDWQYTLIKLITTSALSIPATYAAKESSKHRTMERKYRKMQLELATIDPFIEELPDEKKIELKSEMTKKIFANNDLETVLNEKEDNPISINLIWNLLENAVKGLSNKK